MSMKLKRNNVEHDNPSTSSSFLTTNNSKAHLLSHLQQPPRTEGTSYVQQLKQQQLHKNQQQNLNQQCQSPPQRVTSFSFAPSQTQSSSSSQTEQTFYYVSIGRGGSFIGNDAQDLYNSIIHNYFYTYFDFRNAQNKLEVTNRIMELMHTKGIRFVQPPQKQQRCSSNSNSSCNSSNNKKGITNKCLETNQEKIRVKIVNSLNYQRRKKRESKQETQLFGSSATSIVSVDPYANNSSCGAQPSYCNTSVPPLICDSSKRSSQDSSSCSRNSNKRSRVDQEFAQRQQSFFAQRHQQQQQQFMYAQQMQLKQQNCSFSSLNKPGYGNNNRINNNRINSNSNHQQYGMQQVAPIKQQQEYNLPAENTTRHIRHRRNEDNTHSFRNNSSYFSTVQEPTSFTTTTTRGSSSHPQFCVSPPTVTPIVISSTEDDDSVVTSVSALFATAPAVDTNDFWEQAVK